MPVTSVFGDTDKFDPIIFDTRLNYTVEIEEAKTIFDSAVFGDTDQFDTTRGGEITVDDLLARIQNLNFTLSESTTVTDSLSRLQAIFRTISESTITISDSLSRLLSSLRTITESLVSVTESLGVVRPSSTVYIYDLGFKFDSGVFGDDDQFDLTQSTYEITDSV